MESLLPEVAADNEQKSFRGGRGWESGKSSGEVSQAVSLRKPASNKFAVALLATGSSERKKIFYRLLSPPCSLLCGLAARTHIRPGQVILAWGDLTRYFSDDS